MMMNGNAAVTLPVDGEKLRYRNQFVMGPAHVDALPGWQKIKVNESLCLTAHPALDVLQLSEAGMGITLIGFILDPVRPEATNADILSSLMVKMRGRSRPYEETYGHGGRWILIVSMNDETILFNDAAGLRQVFYSTAPVPDGFWCASQPGMLAELLNLSISDEAAEYIDSYEFRKNPEFRFPGYSTPYSEVKHMLPNHFLQLETRECVRYWPSRPMGRLSPEDAAQVIGGTLRGLMESIAARYEIALPLTAGMDSRIVMAASKELAHRFSFMTVRQIDKPGDHVDVQVPARLLAKLGIEHHVVESSLIMDKGFVGIFCNNTAVPHYIYAPDAHAIIRHYGLERVAVTGSASEIGRSSFKKQLRKPLDETITPEDLARLQKMGRQPLVIRSYEEWLSGLGNVYNVHPLDVFEWEQGHGNWLAMCQLEFDIAWRDLFTPYNCRALLEAMLSVEDEYRESPEYKLHRLLISNQWPELLEVPINPFPEPKRGLLDQIRALIPYRMKREIKKRLHLS